MNRVSTMNQHKAIQQIRCFRDAMNRVSTINHRKAIQQIRCFRDAMNRVSTGSCRGNIGAVPSASERVGSTCRQRQYAFLVAAVLVIEAVGHQRAAQVEVQCPIFGYAEGVEQTEVPRHIDVLGRVAGSYHAETGVGHKAVDTLVGIIADKLAEQLRHVEHRVEMDVEHAEFLLLQPVAVAALAFHVLAGRV